MSRILPTPLVFISGYANTGNVFYCLNGIAWHRTCYTVVCIQSCGACPCTRLQPLQSIGFTVTGIPFCFRELLISFACDSWVRNVRFTGAFIPPPICQRPSGSSSGSLITAPKDKRNRNYIYLRSLSFNSITITLSDLNNFRSRKLTT